MSIVHVTPIDDLIEHEESGGVLCPCVCKPKVQWLEGGGVVVIHHSLDGRELHEEGEL